MRKKLLSFIEQSDQLKNSYLPNIFRLTNPSDKLKFEQLLNNNPNIFVFDEILGQVEELIKSQNPKTIYKKQQLSEAAKNYLGNNGWDEYGVWVFYSWSNRLVHMLDETEFVEVRTNRNQHKITIEEKEILSQKKIGVIGLSVGQSVSVTIAQERICGELRIADFDLLELSNLNRIRTGVHNLGILKTVSVAREIAEIDPFFKVKCFSEGLNEENIEDFLLKDGKLDILIDECDGLDIKVLCRQKAKGFKIPVVMEASDRGTIDVERFDLEPGRPILHGFIDHLDLSKIKDLKTNEEKVPYLLPIAGADTISKKAKASMIEVGQSVTTWPQLASAVTLGGGITVDVCRRMLLNEFHDSGRYFIDVEELIRDKDSPPREENNLRFVPSMTEKDILDLIQKANIQIYENQIELKEDVIREMIAAAVMAPTGANAQPWKWRYHRKNLYLFFDIEYIAQLLDFKQTTSYIGLGAATENLILTAHSLGMDVSLEKFPMKDNEKLVAVFHFFNKEQSKNILNIENHECDFLVDSIPFRVTNRKITPKVPIPKNTLEELQKIARTIPGADLKFIENENDLRVIGEVIACVDRIRIMHKGGHQDFMAEMRWTPEQAEMMKNGVDVNMIDFTPTEITGMNMAKDWEVIKYLNKWKGGKALEKFSRKTAASASAIGLITMPEFNSLGFYEGGRAAERVWLAATQKNIAFQPVTIATLIFNTFLYEKKEFFPTEMRDELLSLRSQFQKIFGTDNKSGEIMLFRIFLADQPEKRSLRVPVDQVLSFSKR